LRCSRVAIGSGVSEPPHIPHRRKPSGFSWPQFGQAITRRAYGLGASFNIGRDDGGVPECAGMSLDRVRLGPPLR
jgi:hypothetical protein